MSEISLFVSAFGCQPAQVRCGPDVRSVMDVSEKSLGSCVYNVVRFVMGEIARQRVVWSVRPAFRIGKTLDTSERVSSATPVTDPRLQEPCSVLFILFSASPPGIQSADMIRIAQSSLRVPDLATAPTPVLQTLLSFRGCPPVSVLAQSRDELISDLCTTHLYTHVLRVVLNDTATDVVIEPSDGPVEFMLVLSRAFPGQSGPFLIQSHASGEELFTMRQIRSVSCIRVVTAPPPDLLLPPYVAAITPRPFAQSLLVGIATDALFTNPRTLNCVCGPQSGMMMSRLSRVDNPDEHRALLGSVPVFYSMVHAHLPRVSNSSFKDVACSIHTQLEENPRLRDSLVRLFSLVVVDVLEQNAQWTCDQDDRSVVQRLRDASFAVDTDADVRRHVAASPFPSCLFSHMAAVMGVTFRVVSRDQQHVSTHVCGDSDHVDVSLLRLNDTEFALLIPRQTPVPLCATETNMRHRLRQGTKPSLPPRGTAAASSAAPDK